VYDITEWVGAHPGGEVILRAAGGSIDPYWDIFTIHKRQDVYDILEQYKIGEIDERDLVNGKLPLESIEDPFVADPIRDSRLHTLTARPCNAETPGNGLADFLTPNELFYVRNHMWVPVVEEPEHRLTIELSDGEERSYTMKDLKERFKTHKVTATLQCAGNRRKNMTDRAKQTNGLQWTAGAISSAEWEGVRLKDVLADAGLDPNNLPDDAKHAQFTGLEAYGASIPMSKAIDPHGDVLLAFKMNGEDLPRDHGFPLRVIVPGNVAARSVKWLRKIVISEDESLSQWQRRDYKSFGPNVGSNPDWSKAKSIQEMPVTSAITSISKPSLPAGEATRPISVEGYAYSGGGREIVRVDISVDGGKTWDQADLVDDRMKGSKAWCWKRWRYTGLRRDSGKTVLLVKATDEAYNTQPESYESIYNARGNLATAWHRVEVESAA
jgi:sulfite oxidase